MYTETDNKKVNILGTEYSIIFVPEDNDKLNENDSDGYVDETIKGIVIGIFKQTNASLKDLSSYQKKVLRHEIIHAFLTESGLGECSNSVTAWARNEEMVDYFARMHEKIHKAFNEVGAI